MTSRTTHTRPTAPRRRAAVLVGLAAALLALAGCSGSSGDTAHSNTGVAGTLPATASVTPSSTPSTPATTTHARSTPARARTTPKPRPSKKVVKKARVKAHATHHPAPHPSSVSTATMHVSGASVYAIGDSVMVDAQPSLYDDIRGVKVDADVSRQTGTGIGIMQSQRASGTIAGVTVFGLGTNGSFTTGQIEQIIGLTAGKKLVIITSHCPYCSWTNGNNANVHALCTAAHHCYVADFQAAANEHPEWFGGDGVHMAIGGAGAQAYAAIVAQTLQRIRGS